MRIVRVVLGAALAAGLAVPAQASAKPEAAAKAKGAKDRDARGKDAKAAPRAPSAIVGADLDAAEKDAQALGDATDAGAHDALLDALSTGLAPRVAAVALASLAKHPAPADVAVVLVYASHRDEDARAAAVAALGAYSDPVAKKRAVAALGDDLERVRAAAAGAIAKGKIREGVERLLALLDKGDEAAPPALAALADADLAHTIAEHLGTAPAGTLATTLGAILKRADFPEPAKVEVVRALAKMPGAEATAALTDYMESTPEKPPRKSRQEAEKVVEARLSGGGGS